MHELADDAPERAVEIAREVSGFSPTAVLCGMSFVQEVRGLNWEEAGAVAREVRNQVFTRGGFPGGDPCLSGEAESAVAFDQE